jgi:hypothetical protein
MTAVELARRVDARRGAKGWLARCPAHADRLPSLSITEGRDGRTLLRCFAGCTTEAIVGALGLKLGDLFRSEARPLRPGAIRTRPTPSRVREELRLESLAMRREITQQWHMPAHTPCECEPMSGRLLVGEVNSVRRSVSAKLGVKLEPIERPIYESAASMGSDRDPAWPAIYERALWLASIRILGEPVSFGDLRPPKAVVDLADDIARRDMRELEHDAFLASHLELNNGEPPIPSICGRQLQAS